MLLPANRALINECLPHCIFRNQRFTIKKGMFIVKNLNRMHMNCKVDNTLSSSPQQIIIVNDFLYLYRYFLCTKVYMFIQTKNGIIYNILHTLVLLIYLCLLYLMVYRTLYNGYLRGYTYCGILNFTSLLATHEIQSKNERKQNKIYVPCPIKKILAG